MIGKTISHYHILEKLGEGGMGVVYKAQDMKLDRLVALKFLPRGIKADDAERARFMQEAKAASALNHPNVCIIYDLHEHEDEQFIVMEYVDGVTLREKIRAEEKSVGAKTEGKHGDLPLPLKDVLSYAIQIGEALQEAHGRGIIHRDVKSDNIMVTAKGQVKVMDFGLAKLKGALRLTKATSTVGTLAYMAPEQLQGKETDARMDIFSFGVVLYEMLTGHMPFRGEYESALMYSILNTEPEPVTKYRPELSSEFLHVLNRALEKDPDDRYLTVNDMLVDLRRLKRDSSKVAKRPSVELLAPEARSPAEHATGVAPAEQMETFAGVTRKRAEKSRLAGPLRYVAPAMIVIILAAAGYFLLRPEAEIPVPRLSNPIQITTGIGVEYYPTWSPDGERLAYGWNGDIWVKQMAAGSPVNLTKDYKEDYWYPRWSPDGSQIAFGTIGKNEGFFVMPAIGGIPRRVATGWAWSSPSWSPDGNELICLMVDSTGTGTVAEIVSLKGGASRRLHLPGARVEFRWDISWSPDGRCLAYVVSGGPPPLGLSQLWVMRIADGKAFPLTGWDARHWNPSWSRDGRYLYFVSNRGGTMDLWRLRIEDDGASIGIPERITTGLEIWNAEFSPDGTRLAYSKGKQITNIWQVPIPKSGTRPVTWSDARQLTFEQSFIMFVDVSPDGKRLVFDSDRAGKRYIWTMPVEGGEMQRVTTDTVAQLAPKWSPDGREIAYGSGLAESRGIWVVPAAGGPARLVGARLAGTYALKPAWSPDGKEIACALLTEGNSDIWTIPAEGGEPRQITTDPAVDNFPDWSPDGKWLLFRSNRMDAYRLWRAPAEGGNPEPVTEKGGWTGVWSPDGKKIYFIARAREGGPNIWEVPAEGGGERQLTDLSGKGGELEGYMDAGLATDGKSLFFVWYETTADIWVMDVE